MTGARSRENARGDYGGGSRAAALVLAATAQLALALGFACGPGAGVARAGHAETPAYIARGDEVQKKYESYTGRLAHAYRSLKTLLKRDAPDLYRALSPAAPKPVLYGYQILPELTRDASPTERRDSSLRAVSTPYSWPRTSMFIEWQIPKVEEMEEQLKAAQSLPPKERRPVYERWVKDYKTFETNQQLVDSHIQYNRFWQQAVADDKPHFGRLTKLHDAVVERQAIQDALAARTEADFSRALFQINDPSLDKYRPRREIEVDLRELESRLAAAIRAENSDIDAPAYIRMSHPRPNVWEAEVPVYTDIGDRRFLKQAQAVIERAWSIEERENTYKMHVVFKYVPPERLYPGKKAPRRGAHIDVRAHAGHFPRDGGVLTTGTNSTYAIPGEYVALGPQALSYNVLAHEFGHLLGFVDGYFRGFHDLGDQGFEVVEIVPDPTDIMCTPGLGHVQSWEYQAVLDSLAKRHARQGRRAAPN